MKVDSEGRAYWIGAEGSKDIKWMNDNYIISNSQGSKGKHRALYFEQSVLPFLSYK